MCGADWDVTTTTVHADHVDPRTYALLADGSTIEIRHARPDDEEAVREMHAGLSPDNAYFRFFSLSPRAPEREAIRVCRPEGDDHLALLALLSGKLVGVATYEVLTAPGRAEIAFAVTDDMHGRGIATLLLEHMVSIARQRHLTAFEAETLPDNYAMQRVFADAGLAVERHFGDGILQLTFPLPAPDSEGLSSYLDAVEVRASRAEVASLRHLFEPATVAVVGAGGAEPSGGRSCTTSSPADTTAGFMRYTRAPTRSRASSACIRYSTCPRRWTSR